MKTKKPKLNYIETITAKDKNIKTLNTSKVPLFDEKGEVIGILGVVNDITEQLKTQKQINLQDQLLIQQSKLASMGEMIANIAHQWRQPLSIISTSATGIKMQKEMGILDDISEIKSLEIINENAQYLSNTIDDFRDFFKKSKTKNSVNLNNLIDKTLKLILTRLKNKNITMIMKLKYYDTLFQVITFYDAKNHDISFDCIDVMKQPWFLQQKNNLHPGMEYNVTFTVKGLGNMKEIIAQLQYFEPVILQKIP